MNSRLILAGLTMSLLFFVGDLSRADVVGEVLFTESFPDFQFPFEVTWNNNLTSDFERPEVKDGMSRNGALQQHRVWLRNYRVDLPAEIQETKLKPWDFKLDAHTPEDRVWKPSELLIYWVGVERIPIEVFIVNGERLAPNADVHQVARSVELGATLQINGNNEAERIPQMVLFQKNKSNGDAYLNMVRDAHQRGLPLNAETFESLVKDLHRVWIETDLWNLTMNDFFKRATGSERSPYEVFADASGKIDADRVSEWVEANITKIDELLPGKENLALRTTIQNMRSFEVLTPKVQYYDRTHLSIAIRNFIAEFPEYKGYQATLSETAIHTKRTSGTIMCRFFVI